MANADPPRRGRVAECAAVTVLFGVATWLLTAPLFDDPSGSLLSTRSLTNWLMSSNTDLFIWVLAWDWHALTTQPWSFWDANILHPTPRSLTAVFPRLGHLPIFGPIYAVTGNPVAAHQWNMLANYALSGGALYALLRHWGVRRSAALAGAFIYALCPARVHAATSPSMVAGQYLPLGLLFLRRAHDRPGWRNGVAATFFLTWQAACSVAHVFLVPLVAIAYATWAFLGRSAGSRHQKAALAIPALVAALLSALMVAPMVAAVAEGRLDVPPGIGPEAYYRLSSAQSLADFFDRATFFRGGNEPNRFATPLYLGWTTVGAALLGVALRRRGVGRIWGAGALLGAAAAAALLSLGPRGAIATKLWLLLAGAIPGVMTVVMPSHLGVLVVFAAATAAGVGFDRVLTLVGHPLVRRVVAAALITIVAWEFRLLRGEHGIETTPRSAYPPRVFSLLAERPAGSLLEIPIDICRMDSNIASSRVMFDSTFHWRPIIDGLSELRPAHRAELQALVATLPDARALDLLVRIGDLRHIIMRASALPVAERYKWVDVDALHEVGFADGRLLLEVDGDRPGEPLTDRFLALDRQATTLLDTPVAPLPISAQRMEAAVELAVATAWPGLPLRARATISNPTDHTWPVLGGTRDLRVHLIHYWVDEAGRMLSDAPERTAIPFDLAPGESVSFSFCTAPPLTLGAVRLQVAVAQGERRFQGEPGSTDVELRPFEWEEDID